MFSWFFFHLSLPVCSPLPFTLVSSVSRLIQMRKKLRLLPSSYSQWGQAKTQLGIYYLSKTFDPEVNFVVNSITLTDLSVIISQVIYLLFEVIMARVEKLEKNTLWYRFCSFHSCFFTFLFLSSTLLISFLFLLFFISFVYAEQLLISVNFNLILLSIIRSFIHLFHYYFVSCYLCVLTDLPILIHVQQVKWQRVLSCGKDCDQVFSCYTVSCK